MPVGLLKRKIPLLELNDQVPAVERRDERAHQLLGAVHLVASEAGREGPSQNDERARARQPRHGQHDHAAVDVQQADSADSAVQARQHASQFDDLRRIDPAARGCLAGSVELDRRGASHEAGRPLERAFGQRVPVLVHEQVLHEGAQAFFLGCAPLAAQPRRWREARVEQGDDRQGRQLEDDLDDGFSNEESNRDREQEDPNKAAEADAQRAQPPRLDRRKVARDEPEASDRLAHACAPDQDPDDRDDRTRGPADGKCLRNDEKDAGCRQRCDRDGMPAPREGDEAVSIEEQRVTGAGEAEQVERAEQGDGEGQVGLQATQSGNRREQDDGEGEETHRPVSAPQPADRGHEPEDHECGRDRVLQPGNQVVHRFTSGRAQRRE